MATGDDSKILECIWPVIRDLISNEGHILYLAHFISRSPYNIKHTIPEVHNKQLIKTSRPRHKKLVTLDITYRKEMMSLDSMSAKIRYHFKTSGFVRIPQRFQSFEETV